MRKKAVLIWILPALCIFLQSDILFAEEKIIHKTGVLSNNIKVAVAISIYDYPKNGFPHKSISFWGAELKPPCNFINQFTIKVGSNFSNIPFSAYSDLTNVNELELKIDEMGFSLIIDGGESSTHFVASIKFDNAGFLIQRTVYSPAFPDEVWEKTEYSFIRRQDM